MTMTSLKNRQWRLVRRPVGMVTPDDFASSPKVPPPAPGENELLVRTLYVSFDPAMRAFLHDRPSYIPPQPIGEVMRAGAVGQVVESRSPQLRGRRSRHGRIWLAGLCDRDRRASAMKLAANHPPPDYLGVLGGIGLTAYFGLLEVGAARVGRDRRRLRRSRRDRIVRRANREARKAAAPSGSRAGRRNAAGCWTSCASMRAIDYKYEDVARTSGGALSGRHQRLLRQRRRATFSRRPSAGWRLHGRIALCGMISGYNDAHRRRRARTTFSSWSSRRIRMEGFLTLDFVPRIRRGAPRSRELDGRRAS